MMDLSHVPSGTRDTLVSLMPSVKLLVGKSLGSLIERTGMHQLVGSQVVFYELCWCGFVASGQQMMDWPRCHGAQQTH